MTQVKPSELGGAFELVGIVAVFSHAGVILAIVLSIAQEFSIVAAAIAIMKRNALYAFFTVQLR